jgi:hypothetical protein
MSNCKTLDLDYQQISAMVLTLILGLLMIN